MSIVDASERRANREMVELIVHERAQVTRVIDILRADLARADVKAQVTAVGVIAFMALVGSKDSSNQLLTAAVGVAAIAAIFTALLALWSTIGRFLHTYVLGPSSDPVERERELLNARHAELETLIHLSRRKFMAIQASYVATALMLLASISEWF